MVHLGAKFTPCMRQDPIIFERIKADCKEENGTGCCIYNDGTGCFQTGQTTCPVCFTIHIVTVKRFSFVVTNHYFAFIF